MDEFVLFEKIEAYLAGRMNEAEKVAFEAQLATDPDLALELEMHRLEHDAMNRLVEQEIKGKFAAWSQEETTDLSATAVVLGKRTFPWIWFALTGLILLSVALFFFQKKSETQDLPAQQETSPQRKNSNDTTPIAIQDQKKEQSTTPESRTPSNPVIKIDQSKIAELSAYGDLAMAEYVKPEFEAPIRTTKRERFRDSIAQKLYGEGKLKEAIRFHRDSFPDEPKTNRWLGHLYFQARQFDQSERYFEKVIQSGEQGFTEEIEYDLLLAYLAQGPKRKREFETLMQKILSDSGHPDFDHATALQKKRAGLPK